MWGRKKKDDDAPQVPAASPSYWATHAEPAAAPQGTGPTVQPAVDVQGGALPLDLAALLQAGAGKGVSTTGTTTSIVTNGRTVDADSPEGRQLMAALSNLGVFDVDADQPAVAATQPPPSPSQPGTFPPPDRARVDAALHDAQADGGRHLADMVALVDAYVHGRIDAAHFDTERGRILAQ